MLRIIGMIADITERVKAEDALREKDKELLEAQRLAGVGNWYWDARNDIVTWSEELYRVFGRDPKAVADPWRILPDTPLKKLERLSHAVDEALRTGASYELDLEVVRQDGSTRWVRARGESVGDDSGQTVALRGTCQDITERTQAEKALSDMKLKAA